MPHNRQISDASSYAPILIHPTDSPSTPDTACPQPTRLKLVYPYPLHLLAVLDLAYTLRQQSLYGVSPSLWTLCGLRVLVLVVVLGLSRDWRSRGGWIAVISVGTTGAAVWKVCEGQLKKGMRTAPSQEVLPVSFLACTAAYAAFEYTTFLLLLRLSPAGHRLNPLALRMPPSAIQTSTAFDYTSEPAEGGSSTPTATRRTHLRQPSQLTLLSQVHTAGESASDEDEIDFSDDTSSVSENSIIDLPLPMSPSRIVPPRSISLNRGLNVAAAAIDSSPMIGAVVRRTRSARLLGRSWSSRNGNIEIEDGYGTFGRPWTDRT